MVCALIGTVCVCVCVPGCVDQSSAVWPSVCVYVRWFGVMNSLDLNVFPFAPVMVEVAISGGHMYLSEE
jgi:hypothetical protein